MNEADHTTLERMCIELDSVEAQCASLESRVQSLERIASVLERVAGALERASVALEAVALSSKVRHKRCPHFVTIGVGEEAEGVRCRLDESHAGPHRYAG